MLDGLVWWVAALLPLLVAAIVALYWYWSRNRRMVVKRVLERVEEEDRRRMDEAQSEASGPVRYRRRDPEPWVSPRMVFLGFLSLLVLLVSFYILLSHPDASGILRGPEYPEAATNVSAGAIGGILTFWFTPKA